MKVFTTKEKINLSNAKALRRSRERLKETRAELGNRLKLSAKAIEKCESGRACIDEETIVKIIEALNLTIEEFKKIKRGKGIGWLRRARTVFANNERRSYKKLMAKEVRVL
jgi:DNA-binding XRE family transcriptional regulator